MRNKFQKLKPQNLVEGVVLVLSIALVIATVALVLANQTPTLATPDRKQAEVKLEAYGEADEPEGLSEPVDQAKSNALASVIKNRVAGRTDTLQRSVKKRVDDLFVDLNKRATNPLSLVDSFFSPAATDRVPDQDLAAALEDIDPDPEGLVIAEPDWAQMPPAVEEPPAEPFEVDSYEAEQDPGEVFEEASINLPAAVEEPTNKKPISSQDKPQSPYAPTADKDNKSGQNNKYAPTAGSKATEAPTRRYAPVASSTDKDSKAYTPHYAPSPDKNPKNNPTVMPTEEQIAKVEAEIFAKINEARRAAGIHELKMNATIKGIAKLRAKELSEYYHPKHYRQDGSYALAWINLNWGTNFGVGENIAWIDNVASLNTDLIFNAFYNSGKGHKEIMLHPTLNIGAVGIYCVPGPVADNNTGRPNDSNKGRIFISMNFGY